MQSFSDDWFAHKIKGIVVFSILLGTTAAEPAFEDAKLAVV